VAVASDQLGHMQVCTSLQTDNHASTSPLVFFTGRMPFLPPNQQRQSTEGTMCIFCVYRTLKLINTGTPDTIQTGPSCRVWCGGVNWVGRTSAFSVGVCRAAQCDRRTHSDAERTCQAVGPTQFTPPDTTPTALSCRVWRAV